jgi:hypothetical protein
MHETDLFTLFTRPFDIAGLDYFVTGSVASMIYGEPRLTLDVDIILTLPSGDLKKLTAAFPEDSFYIPPLEVLRIEAARPQRGSPIKQNSTASSPSTRSSLNGRQSSNPVNSEIL